MPDRPLVCSCGVLLLGQSYDVYNGDTGALLGVYCSAQCPDLRRGSGRSRRDEPAVSGPAAGRGSLAGANHAGPPLLGGRRRPRVPTTKRVPGGEYDPVGTPFPWDAA